MYGMNKDKINIRTSSTGTEPESRILNIINCDQSVAGIMSELIKMNKNIMSTPIWKATKLICVDQT